MGGRGSSNPGGSGVSAERMSRIRNGIATHSREENDRAEQNMQKSIEREKAIVDREDDYINSGFIKSASDSWFQGHVDTYNSLVSQLKAFRKERKRQNR